MQFTNKIEPWADAMKKASHNHPFAVGSWLGDYETHVGIASDEDGIWFVSICRRCGDEFFEYVGYGDGWPAEARCRKHRF